MGTRFYTFCRLGCRFVRFQCVRDVVLGLERTQREGPFILAITHLSHLEPVIVGTVVQRYVRWMARVEFYRTWWGSALLRGGGAFPVDRFGWSLPAVRTAERFLREGDAVGLFPEGGVAQGDASVLRGGPIKGGVCTIAVQTGVPVVPVVVLGTHDLNRVGPWLPFKRARCWIAFGRDVNPPPRTPSRRQARREMTEQLRAAFARTFQELCVHAELDPSIVPARYTSDNAEPNETAADSRPQIKLGGRIDRVNHGRRDA